MTETISNLVDPISTHALTWSATFAGHIPQANPFISTHALTWSATGGVGAPPTATRDFNSRTHVECDAAYNAIFDEKSDFNSRTHVECDKEYSGKRVVTFISTHALTWSATTPFAAEITYGTFQLTHSRGVRRIMNQLNKNRMEFQLTHSRGVRQPAGRREPKRLAFQLTHSRGVRPDWRDVTQWPGIISTHALTWSATAQRQSQWIARQDFNSRTHVECDTWIWNRQKQQKISTHALTWSATDGCPYEWDCQSISTHALTWSATTMSVF